MLFTVGVVLVLSLSTINLSNVQGCPDMCTCSGTTVDCSNKGLTQIPNTIPSSTTNLFLPFNSITSIDQNVFSGLTSLHVLTLSFNSITSIDQNVFSGLTSLQLLYLTSNSITSIEQNAFSGLTSLHYLELGTNSLTSIEKNVFSGLVSLRELYLTYNSITSIDQHAFSGLSSLQTLDIRNNLLVCCSVIGFVDWVNGRSSELALFGTCTHHNNTTEIRMFNTTDCIVPVDGGWSDWEHSTCSVTCGDGTVKMNRTCNNPVPSGGGKNCSGESTDTNSCYLGDCPEPCSRPGKESYNKSGKRSDNKSRKLLNKKSGGKSNGKNGKKGNKPNRNGWY